jgi:YbbR domain-containing protein
MKRAMRFLVRNWPLKLAAVVLASLLWAGLVLSQDASEFIGRIPITPRNQPDNAVLLSGLRDVERIRYIAPADVGRLGADDFIATVDLSDVDPAGGPVTVRVDVQTADPRVTIVEVRPQQIQVVLDPFVRREVPVRVERGTIPGELEIGPVIIDPPVVTVSGPASVVRQVDSVVATVAIDPTGLDVDREVEPIPVDAAGEMLSPVDVNPRVVRVTIPVFADRRSRRLPVTPIIDGVPATGFRIASVETDPLIVGVEGEGERLQLLTTLETEPVSVTGATRNVETVVDLALPTGITTIDVASVRVLVRIVPITETRSYNAGLRLDGAQAGLRYTVSPDRVVVTLFGSVVDLDRLSSEPLTVGLNIASLEPGVHEVTVAPILQAGVTLVSLSPQVVTVTVEETAASVEAGRPSLPTPGPAP